jgi:hypothetical protein
MIHVPYPYLYPNSFASGRGLMEKEMLNELILQEIHVLYTPNQYILRVFSMETTHRARSLSEILGLDGDTLPVDGGEIGSLRDALGSGMTSKGKGTHLEE